MENEQAGWLQTYLNESTERRLCTGINCTTCGALEFRRGLWDRLHTVTALPCQPTRVGALTIAEALVAVSPVMGSESEFERAVRLILFDVWVLLGSGAERGPLENQLGSSWAGEVLARMRAHSAKVQAERQARMAFEAGAEARREEKRRLKRERHAARLAKKAERDRVWHQRHSKQS